MNTQIDWNSITLEELAAYVSEELRTRGIKVVLVGGACVTIHSHNRYQSYDLDFITYVEMNKVTKALKEIGFCVQNRYFVHEDCPWFIEFVSPPIAIGNQPVEHLEVKLCPLGAIHMLTPTDSVKDRLAGFYHWNDRQSLEQAIDICLECNINTKDIKTWSENEGSLEKYKEFARLLEKVKSDT